MPAWLLWILAISQTVAVSLVTWYCLTRVQELQHHVHRLQKDLRVLDLAVRSVLDRTRKV